MIEQGHIESRISSSLAAQLPTIAASLMPEFVTRPDHAFHTALSDRRGEFTKTSECTRMSWGLAMANAWREMAEARNYIKSDTPKYEANAHLKTSFASLARSRYRTPAFPSSTPYAYYHGVVSQAAKMHQIIRNFATAANTTTEVYNKMKLASVSAANMTTGASQTATSSTSASASSSSSTSTGHSASANSTASSSSSTTSSPPTRFHSGVCPDIVPDPIEVLKLAGLPNPLQVPRGELPLEYFEMDPAGDSDRTDLLWPANQAPPKEWIPPGIELTYEEMMSRLGDDYVAKAMYTIQFVVVKVARMIKKFAIGFWTTIRRYTAHPELIGPKWQHIKSVVKHEAKHYWHGTKLLAADIGTACRLAMRRAQGGTLTRRERRQLVRTTGDIFRLIPFAVIVIVPFLELALPLLLKLFPNFLPSTFQDKHQEAAKIKNELKARLELADFLQDTMDTLARQKLAEAQAFKATAKSAVGDAAKIQYQAQTAEKMMEIIKMVRSGQRVDNEQLLAVATLFQDDITLDNLSRAHLVAMCKYMKLSPFGSDTALRERLRDKVEEIREDDELIEKEGIQNLTLEELREACRDRGMRVIGLTKAGLIRNITAWIDLSVHKRVPASLLLLSRALSISERPLDESLMTALSSIDESTVDEVFSDAGLDRQDPETRLESIRRQNEIIAEEMESRRALYERQKQAKQKEAKESEEEKTEESKEAKHAETAEAPATGEAAAATATAAAPAGVQQPAAKPATKPAAVAEDEPTPEDLTHLSDALTDLASPSAVSSERERLKRLKAEQEEIEAIVKAPPEEPSVEAVAAAAAAATTTTPAVAATTSTAAAVESKEKATEKSVPSTPASTTETVNVTTAVAVSPTAASIAKTAAEIRARAARERMLAEKKAQEAMRARIELENALAKLPNKETAMDLFISTMTPGSELSPSQLPSVFWPKRSQPALPLWQAGLIDDKGRLRAPETPGQERILNRYALRVARQLTRYLDRYERERRAALESADSLRRNRHMTTLSKQVNSMLKELETRIENADRTIGSQLHLLDKDLDGRISTRELQIVFKEHLKAASTEEEAAALVSKIKKLSASKGWYMSVDDIKRLAQEFSELTEEERLVYLEQQEQAARNASEAQAKLRKFITATAAAHAQAATAREAMKQAERVNSIKLETVNPGQKQQTQAQ